MLDLELGGNILESHIDKNGVKVIDKFEITEISLVPHIKLHEGIDGTLEEAGIKIKELED